MFSAATFLPHFFDAFFFLVAVLILLHKQLKMTENGDYRYIFIYIYIMMTIIIIIIYAQIFCSCKVLFFFLLACLWVSVWKSVRMVWGTISPHLLAGWEDIIFCLWTRRTRNVIKRVMKLSSGYKTYKHHDLGKIYMFTYMMGKSLRLVYNSRESISVVDD